MKYSIQAHIKTANDGIRNAFGQLIPSESDPRLCGGDYHYECLDTVDDDGNKVFACNITFNIKGDRDVVVASMKGLAPIINACDVGSYIMEYKSYYDEMPIKSIEVEAILRKE